MGDDGVLSELEAIAGGIAAEFKQARRVLSFQQYLALFAEHPGRYARDASRYVRDVFTHYGTREVHHPWGTFTRYQLFDLPFLDEARARREALVGQEAIQQELFRSLNTFVREGRANRLPMLHGPNGSAKSTVASCIMKALEDYSRLDEGALYRFHWVFPSKRSLRGTIGFGGSGTARHKDPTSYAQLPDEEIDARLVIEVRDHPLFLLPASQRERLVGKCFERAGKPVAASDWLLRGMLSHKNSTVFEALLASYDGSLEEVLRHVQVERYYISRRYRTGAVTIGPQMTVDAGERQITADRSLSALPSALQAVSMFEAHGELVDASGGVLEFSDLLKRPLEAFRYLQQSVETGEVALQSQTVQLNCVMIASVNEIQLTAFREHHEYESFRGRLELIQAGYLRSWLDEQRIYDQQIAGQVRKHVSPHATRVAAMFAVLTRMRRPNPERFKGRLSEIVEKLTAVEKMDLYATRTLPSRLDADAANLLGASIDAIYDESVGDPIYEGAIGASPREMRTVLFDAAQNAKYSCLSPFAVLEELAELCERRSEYGWLQQDKLDGGYHDYEHFRDVIRARLLDLIEDEFRIASGLVEEVQYRDLFDRYVNHVNYWVKKEKVPNEVTGKSEAPDARLMAEVEKLLQAPSDVEEWRNAVMSRIAAWAIDHPGQPVANAVVFAEQVKRLRDAVFVERRGAVARASLHMLQFIREDVAGLSSGEVRDAKKMLDSLCTTYGYESSSVADAAGVLVRDRFAELLG